MEYCIKCSGTGKYKQPKNDEEFDKVFDYYDKQATLSLGECYDKAINEVSYTIVPCTCGKGKEYAEKLEEDK